MEKLIKYIKDLNIIISKIKNKEEVELNLVMILPLLQIMKSIDLITSDEINMIINNASFKIKELEYFKFSEFVTISEKIDEYLSEFTDELINLFPKNVDIQGISFLLYEILINVYKHSKFKNAYIQIINSENNEYNDICIFDNGIGIPGSFKESKISSINDCEAIFDAINGKTTDKEKDGLHGRGLNSTARITTLGFDGKMLIASGMGICVISKEGAKTYKNTHEINGTFVIMRIKNKKLDNIYNYLKREKINKIKED